MGHEPASRRSPISLGFSGTGTGTGQAEYIGTMMSSTKSACALFVVLLGTVAHSARAQDPRAAAPTGVSGPGCVLRGSYPVARGTTIHDAPSGGRTVASFTGAHQAFALSDFPADPTTARARVSTSSGPPSLRIDGFTLASSFAIYTTRDVPIAPSHVWIADAQRVRLVAAASGVLTGEVAVPGTTNQTARAAAPCDAWAVEHRSPTPMAVPGDARGYLTKGSSLELFDSPGGSVVFTLRASEGTAQLFWSTESRNGFVHVRTRGTLVVDAWARARDLDPLKKGEMMDQFAPPTTAVAAATLKLDGEPRLVRAARDIPIRARRDDKEKPIGVLEAGAEVFVIETVLGFTNVMPKNLGLSPGDDGGFWLPTAELNKP